MKKILLIGSTCVDVILHIDHLPRTAEDLQPKSQTLALGGCAYNAANIVRQSGVPYLFLTPVGTGIYGDFIRNAFKRRNLPIHISPDQENGCCYCLVDADGERTFLSLHGVEYTFSRDWMKGIDLSDFSMIYVCGLEIEESTGNELISWLEENRGPELFFAPGSRPLAIPEEKRNRLYRLHPVLHVNEEEAFALSGVSSGSGLLAAAQALQKQTQNTVIITRGADGSCCLESGKLTLTEAAPVHASVVDTIGAGDSHVGQVMASRAKGCSWQESLEAANRVSARVVSVSGAGLADEQYRECFSGTL